MTLAACDAALLKVVAAAADDQRVTAPPEGSIDALIAKRHRRRLLVERVSMICAGAIITAMFAAFYSILSS